MRPPAEATGSADGSRRPTAPNAAGSCAESRRVSAASAGTAKGAHSIPARLVNGSSILRETGVSRSFVYYHVELDDHS